jgi:type IV pilus assembly protein PilC
MGVFFKFILPRFTTIFSQFHIKLPFITELLIKISDLVNNNFLLLVGFMVAIIVAFIKFRQSDKGKQILDRIKLIIPLIKGLVLYAVLERFSSTVYILLESGVPITYTLDVAAKSSGNSVIGKDIERVRDNVKKGKSFADELEKVEFFPPLISEIAKVGEEAGNMPEMFEKISEHYQLQLTTKMERLVAAFEPLVIFLLGGMIGVVVIALFMPIFKLVTLGGGGGGF